MHLELVVHIKRGQLVNFRLKFWPKGMQRSWFLLEYIKDLSSRILNQHSNVKKYLTIKAISQYPICEFHLKRCQIQKFAYLLCSLSFSTSNLQFTLCLFQSSCLLFYWIHQYLSAIYMFWQKKFQWQVLIFKMVWWSQVCICSNIIHCRDFYIPLCWYGCLRHW